MRINSIGGYSFNKNLNNKVNRKNNEKQDLSFKGKLEYKKSMLLIFDGLGLRSVAGKANPFKDAKMPNFKSLMENAKGDSLYRWIEASGVHVGLPTGMVGSSEVGHNNLGAGRLVPQDLMVIDNALKDGSFYRNEAILGAIKSAKEQDKTLHVMGLLSDGHVHSETSHLHAILQMARDNGVKDVRVHAFLDGRDVPEGSAPDYVARTNKVLRALGYEPIASMMGMFYPMDRAKNWEKTAVAFDLLTDGRKFPEVDDLCEDILSQYKNGTEDRNILPRKSKSYKPISDGDSVIFFNYRPDRTIQLTDSLTQENCVASFLNGVRQPKNLNFVCMSQYKPEFNLPIAFKPQMHRNTLTQIMSENEYRPFRCTETEKQPHLTFFFDGKRHVHFDGVSDVFIASEKKFTPPMRLHSIVDYLKVALKDNTTKFILSNWANADMIGHNGTYDDAVKALEEIDWGLGEILPILRKEGIAMVATCDHGNIEDMTHGAHTNNPVPFFTLLPGKESEIARGEYRLRPDLEAALKDVAPTVLKINNLQKPFDMSGTSILETNKKVY